MGHDYRAAARHRPGPQLCCLGRPRPAGAPPAELWDQTHEAAAQALDRERLARSLNELTGLQREVITLAYFGGHTHRQVAAIVGAPLGTVKGRIRAALIKLRHAMTSPD